MVVCCECRDSGDVELGVGFTEPRTLLQNRRPREASLVHFEEQAFEEIRIGRHREAIFRVVVPNVAGIDVRGADSCAIAHNQKTHGAILPRGGAGIYFLPSGMKA